MDSNYFISAAQADIFMGSCMQIRNSLDSITLASEFASFHVRPSNPSAGIHLVGFFDKFYAMQENMVPIARLNTKGNDIIYVLYRPSQVPALLSYINHIALPTDTFIQVGAYHPMGLRAVKLMTDLLNA